jgi:predicted CXXCH cytochrome family protein
MGYKILDQENWSNSTLNQAGGFYSPSGCACHGGSGTIQGSNHYFAYRQPFVDYEPAGGAGCLECHDNNASAYNETPIRPIVNLTAIKLAMHTNLSGAFRTGSDLQGTDRNFDEWLQYRGYTGEQINNITEDNAICWACHCTNGTPPNPYFHPDRALNPYKCPKCHGPYDGQPPHTQGLVAAIDNHGPTTKGAESILIQTDVGSGGSCGDCHAPSVLPDEDIGDLKVWKYNPSKSFVTYNGRSTMGDVSHYGLNKTQGLALGIDNPLFNTTNCLFCHCNWTNGQIWGNATNISGNMYGADTTNLSTCYTYCHVRPAWGGSVNNSTLSHFHNESIYAGGGPNCTLCHDIGSKYGVQSLVNATAIKMGIHGNMLNNTLVHETYGMDNRSNPCWGCHNSDGTIPEGMGDRNGITDLNEDGVITADELPYTCEDCHARSKAWVGATGEGHTWESASDPDLGLNKLPPVIYTHYPNSKGRCVDCHNNSIDSHRNDTAEKIIGNTIFANVSHYGTTADLIYPTEACAICHNNGTNGTIWGDAPQNEHGNFTNYSNPEDGCYRCHTNDNETPVDLHAANLWSGKGGFECLSCHDKEGFAKRKRINGSVFGEAIHKDVNNASDMAYGLNRSCWACHFENGTNADKHSIRKKPPYLCYDCHRKTAPPFGNVSAAPEVHNHFKSGTSIQAYWGRPTDSDSCMGCHNQSEMKYAFTENDTYRTNFSVVAHYGNNRTDLVDKFDESNTKDYCGYCHKNTSTPFCLYYDWITQALSKNPVIYHRGDRRSAEINSYSPAGENPA